ncbi:GNAT family N-acetyltransferase [Kocuria flava]|uniref:GNAT family N-acetyltransferase n=1 Tax=Kocuria flava TaxID=446860 RepID=UPI003F1CF2DE
MIDVLPPDTDRLSFRRFRAEDLDPMHSYQSREDYAQYAWRGPRSRADCERAIAENSGLRPWGRDGDHVRFAVTPRGSDELVGEIVMTLVDAHAAQVEIGWVVHPEHTGQGYASEAARAAIGFAFGPLGAHRVRASLDALNISSAKVCERLGMRLEATLRESHHQLGQWRDELVYAVLAEEFLAEES